MDHHVNIETPTLQTEFMNTILGHTVADNPYKCSLAIVSPNPFAATPLQTTLFSYNYYFFFKDAIMLNFIMKITDPVV